MPELHGKDWEKLDGMFRRNFFNSLTGFKSLCLIGTQNAGGKTNLAPFTQVIHIGANPPLTGILFRPHTVQRDTLENILETKAFTLNQVRPEFVHEAHYSAASWEISEFEGTGLQEEYLFGFPAPFVKESHIKWACSLQERLDVQSNGTILIVGLVEHVIVPDAYVGADGFIDLEAAETVTASGLDAYHRTQRLSRLSYPKPGKPPEILP
jgi:flavin reductase (DIM6/NTAB) family NADH-FMN oxidoreductase RutF